MYATFAFLQWREMAHTNDLTQEALNANARSSVASGKSTRDALSIGLGQWREMQEANKIARAAQQQTQEIIASESRPWLGVQHVDLLEFTPGKKLRAKATLLNSGKTAAIDVVTITGVGLWTELPKHKAPEIRSPSFGHMTILPNMGFVLPLLTDAPISIEQVEAIKSGSLYFVVGGHIAYRDRFGQRHKTSFCGYYTPEQREFSICGVGNSAE